MELQMFIGDQFIDKLPVSFSRITTTGYLEGLCGQLSDKHRERIDASGEQPTFFIDHVPSSMNFNRLRKKGN